MSVNKSIISVSNCIFVKLLFLSNKSVIGSLNDFSMMFWSFSELKIVYLIRYIVFYNIMFVAKTVYQSRRTCLRKRRP